MSLRRQLCIGLLSVLAATLNAAPAAVAKAQDKGKGVETTTTVIEMEALTAVSVGLLTLYDMVKSSDPAMVLGPVRLLRKSGGRSGPWARPTPSSATIDGASAAAKAAGNAAVTHG